MLSIMQDVIDAECQMFINVQYVIILNVFMMSVIMLRVATPM